MRRLTEFQEGVLAIIKQPDAKEVVSTRKRNRLPVGKRIRGVDGPVAKAFRERYHWEGSISLKSLGQELWTTYQKFRYHYRKYGNFDNFEEK